ncbi:UNVERIFIED_CONTAM: hypothetical protein PYX00_001490 [Menopon gallinae]|uniref:Uncharacterized protein n=1 Tax=Menopon gallinae TaxID=328185 RepID=A0AAW2IEB1_9NEOP
MRFNPSTFRSILFTTTIISAVQSLLWLGLTLSAILTFRCVINPPKYNEDGFILTTLVKLYFEGDGCKVDGDPPDCPDIKDVDLTKPVDVFSWMIAFFIISLIHLIITLIVFRHRHFTGKILKFLLQIWCTSMLVISILDVVLTIMFVLDYCKLSEHVDKQSESYKNDVTKIPSLMFSLSARGFVLWLINVAQMIYLFAWIVNENEEEMERKILTTGRHPPVKRMMAYDNQEFKHSSESLADRRIPKPPENTDLFREEGVLTIHRNSFEMVTPFNVEENEPSIPEKPRAILKKAPIKREPNPYPCDCYQRTVQDKGGPSESWYHQHSCSRLRSELEEKLQTLRFPETPKPKKLTDFSHDIKNFERGSGQGKTQARVGFHSQEAARIPPVPSAVKCKDSDFF